MKNLIHTLLILLLVGFNLEGQSPIINVSESTPSEKLCGGKIIKTYQKFLIYQTQNDLHDGIPIDTCIDFTNGFSSNTINPSKKLFIKPNIDLYNRPLTENYLYELSGFISRDSAFLNPTAPSELTLEYDHYDSLTFIESKIVKYPISQFSDRYLTLNTCLTTQKFKPTRLKNIYFTLNLNPTFKPTNKIYLYLKMYPIKPDIVVDTIPSLNANKIVNNELKFTPKELYQNYYRVFLLRHTKNGIPSSQNIDKKIFKIRPNPSTVTNLIFTNKNTFFQEFFIQDFIEFDTEVAEGKNEKHKFTLDISQARICNLIVELIMNDDQVLRVGNSTLELPSTTSCIQIKNNASLVIAENEIFRMGPESKGMFLFDNGNINVENNASLIVENMLLLKNDNHLFLNKNSKLKFLKTSSINKINDLLGTMVIHGWKHQIDLNELPIDYHKYISIIEPSLGQEEKLECYPNPASDILTTNINLSKNRWFISDITGKKMSCSLLSENKIDISILLSGIYILHTEYGNQKFYIYR